jgi:D-beta-D-heptose 7-phosphate kinase/D-beta-D-heptose 1-phosphate adenosyltransferase
VSGRVVIVGDTFLDRDVVGHADRLCPDAPVPVLDESSVHERPGGAGLTALLASRADVEVVLITALADDSAGARVRDLLHDRVELHAATSASPTPEKVRLRSRGQSLMRLDRGGPPGAIGALDHDARRALADSAVVVVSDYGRGMAAHPEARELLAAVGSRPRQVVWDPHPRGARPLPGVRVVTPNHREAVTLSGGPAGSDPAAVASCAETLVRRWQVGAVAVTLGAAGALLSFGGADPMVFPAPYCDPRDVCGAGDAFAVAAALSLGSGAIVSEAVSDAVAYASRFVADGAASTVDAEVTAGGPSENVVARVRASGGRIVATGGCFDLLHAGHVSTLHAARALGDCLVVCINSDESVRRLKGPGRPVVRQDDRVRVVGAVSGVDAVMVFDEDTPERLLADLRPDVWVKGGDYAGVAVAESALLRTWGGQAVLVPYLDGRSTTELISQIR